MHRDGVASTLVTAGPDLDLDLLAASLRADSGDVGAFVESLAVKLEAAVPGRVHVERRRSGLLGAKRVQSIALDGADRRLELELAGGVLEARASKVSGGIVLKREAVDLDSWLALLGEVLAEEARRSEATRRALERLLIG
jgi:hypothetical protein